MELHDATHNGLGSGFVPRSSKHELSPTNILETSLCPPEPGAALLRKTRRPVREAPGGSAAAFGARVGSSSQLGGRVGGFRSLLLGFRTRELRSMALVPC